MGLSEEQIRLLLHFQWKSGLKAAKAGRKICDVNVDGICKERKAQRWFKTFREEGDRLPDLPRSGRPQEVNCQALINKIEEQPSMTTQMLADEFDCHHSTIEDILHEAGEK